MELKYNKELLYKLYVKEGLSLSKIAALYSVTSMSIRAWLIKNGIQTRPSTQTIYKELKITPFSDSQKSLIVGSLLGDGSLAQRGDCKNARFSIRHGADQRDYLIWKKNMLKPFTKSKISHSVGGDHEISGVKCKTKDSYIFTTISHPYLTDLRSIFYPHGVKAVPFNIVSMINNLAMVIWFCDDGCFTYSKKYGIYRLDLHTESFIYNDNLFLCREVLSKFFNKPFRINSRKYKSGKAYYICISGKEDLTEIVSILKPFIPKCMLYKFKHYII